MRSELGITKVSIKKFIYDYLFLLIILCEITSLSRAPSRKA